MLPRTVHGPLAGFACFLLLVWSSVAFAGGTQANELAGRGGPVADSARGLFGNPAAIGPIDGISTDFDLQVEIRDQSHGRDTTLAQSKGGETFETVGSSTVRTYPSFAYASDLGLDWFTLGFGVSLPWRYGTDWPTDGAQRYHSIFVQSTGIALSPTVAISPLDWLHLGASFHYTIAEYESYRAADLGRIVARQEGVDPESVPDEDPGNEGREFLEFNEGVPRWSAGLTLTPGDVRIGAAYHSGASMELDGTYRLVVPNNTFYQQQFGGDVERQATLRTSRPSSVRLGVAWSASKALEVYGHGEWTRWSTVDELDLDVEEPSGGGFPGAGGSPSSSGGGGSARDFGRNQTLDWRDAFGIRLGGRYRLNSTFALDGELGFETSAIPDERLDPRILDASKVTAAAGLRWRTSDAVSFRFGYQHVQHLSRTVRETRVEPPSTGSYKQWIGIAETGFSYHFQ